MTVLLLAVARFLLGLRYRVRVTGLDAVAAKGRRGILFLPSHPALIDPIILVSRLYGAFAPRALADRDQIDRPFFRGIAARFRTIPLKDISQLSDAAGRQAAQAAMGKVVKALAEGENIILYPAGHIAWSHVEELGGNSGVETILKALPGVRIVLVRTRGLWGSSFSRASGRMPDVGKNFARAARALLASGLFFAPRREVSIELVDPPDFPCAPDRNLINRYLEAFYNANPPPNTYVPYTPWERGGTRAVPEPAQSIFRGDLNAVSAATRSLVIDKLRKETGVTDIRDDLMLARDLGLDSLALVSLAAWLEKEFGYPVGDAAASLTTVGDVILAACGTVPSTGRQDLLPIPANWLKNTSAEVASIPAGDTITAVFLQQARAFPDQPLLADQGAGVKTYRDIVTAVLALKPELQELDGEYLGIMLPAAAGTAILYLAALFAGKTPVMVNWTVGTRNMIASLDMLGVTRIVTAARLVEKLKSQGLDLAPLQERFVFVEEVGRRMSKAAKLRAWLKSRTGATELRRARVRDVAVVLFTSGSESLPKAVPLTHANFMTNVRDVAASFRFRRSDRMLGILPPFHSFGILGTLVFPLCGALPVVYHPNPTEGGILASLVEAYGVSLLIGTPTFLAGIVRLARDEQLKSLRIVVSGAEKCPAQLYESIARRWPHMKVLEGYGITECSPVVSANREEDIRPGTIGRTMPSVEYAIQGVENGRRVERGQSGLLLVRGPSIFGGYLKFDGPSPFVEFEGKTWYRTGDLVSEDAAGVLTFAGRMKRFVKIGGEMISLPAIEDVLLRRYGTEKDDKPVLAVEATPVELNPALVLFTVRDLDREAVNAALRAGGLSPIYNLRHVVKLDEIPVLGTGKIDYRNLKLRLGKS